MQAMNAETHQDLSLSHKAKCTFTKAIAALIAITAFSSVAYADEKTAEITPAQGRVVEDSLVYNDPTVGNENQWAAGITLDYNNFSNTFVYPNSPYADATQPTQYAQSGIGAFVGYGDYSVLLNYRQGTGNGTITYPYSAPWTNQTLNDNFTISSYEVDFRWLLSSFQYRYFVPYVLYVYQSESRNDTRTGSWFGTPLTQTDTSSITASGFGIGGIIPISEIYGFRVDIRGTSVQDNFTYAGTTTQYTYPGSESAITAYYNITKSSNVQLGYKTMTYQGYPVTGQYVLLGYTFR